MEQRPLSILVVDDDQDALDLIVKSLKTSEIVVKTALDGDAAESALRSAKFDVVVTDILMPKKDGVELIGFVRKWYPDMKIIAISGGGRTASDYYLTIAKALGAHAALAKPFEGDELVEVIEALFKPPTN